MRAVRLREPVWLFRFGHCWPDRKGNRPRLPWGVWGTAGAFGVLLNQPSSDGEHDNAAARNSFPVPVVVAVEIMVVPVAMAIEIMLTGAVSRRTANTDHGRH